MWCMLFCFCDVLCLISAFSFRGIFLYVDDFYTYILYMLFCASHFVVAQMEAVHKPPKNTGFDLILKTSHLIFFSPHIYVNRLYFILIIFLVRYYLDSYFQHFRNIMKTFCILYTVIRGTFKINEVQILTHNIYIESWFHIIISFLHVQIKREGHENSWKSKHH